MLKLSKELVSMRDAILDWGRKHNDEIQNIEESCSKDGYEIRISPINDKSSRIFIALFADGKKFELGVGRTMYFEDIDATSNPIIEICEAVRRGDVVEKLWLTGKGKLIKSKGELRLGRNIFHFPETSHSNIWFLSKCEEKEMKYEPFSKKLVDEE